MTKTSTTDDRDLDLAPSTIGGDTDRRRGLTAGIVFIITGIIGSIASFLLLYERVQLWINADHSTACDVNPWVSCGQVMEAWQASTFGFPNIFIGVVAFPLLILAGIALMLAGKSLLRSRVWWSGMAAGAAFSFGFIVWLWYSAVFDIGVLCPYCMIAWAATIPFAVYVLNYIISTDVFDFSFSKQLKTLAESWWWVIVLVLYLAVIASIVIMFPHIFTY